MCVCVQGDMNWQSVGHMDFLLRAEGVDHVCMCVCVCVAATVAVMFWAYLTDLPVELSCDG